MRGHQFFLCVFLGLFVAGCAPAGQNFLANGPGAKLEANDIAATQIRSNDYFKYLCKQAGLITYSGSYNSCLPNPGDAHNWMTLTYQGLNDIDRRCDSYLQWLDNKKRSKAPLLSQIASIDTATTAILGATGVSGAPLTIVAAGFGLVRQSVENYHSRLLLEIESSTINSVVLNEQRRFRGRLKTDKVIVDNKPAAEYVLRTYLRICLPFSIETSINNFSTLGSKGIAADNNNSIDWSPVVRSFESGDTFTPPDRVDSTYEEASKIFKNPDGYFKTDVIDIQKRICTDPDGKVRNKTKVAILLTEDLIHQGDTSKFDGKLDETEISTIRGWPEKECDHKKYYGYFEYLLDNNDTQRTALFNALKRVYPEKSTTDFKSVTSLESREVFAKLHTDKKVQALPGAPTDAISRHLLIQILKL
ncbi:hypothetical protein [Labrenzia sp. OB1]|uniref:hypothetical protein n=1 Tax=Labrenzia sp. OB1 TaxID=1561204 RepID=UPI000A66544D|nr:hypothetical protein [Labrenzia sp. OB1]